MKPNYRKLWIEHYGAIPKDIDGRTHEIHHKDGNHSNNSLDNLICVTIKEHYDIHYAQGDYGACVLIARRLEMPSDYLSNIQKGVKRPGIGGVKKGTRPWNKGVSGYKLSFTVNGKENKLLATKRNNKIKDIDAENIRTDYIEEVFIDDLKVGKVQQNGRIYTYERAFCLLYAKKYEVSDQYIYRIIKNKSKNV
jgi:hypothetical protein